MTRASTAGNIYWGNGGEYGPFPEQQTGEWAGWPDFGKVLRYFREKAKMDQAKFAAIYGKQFHKNGKPITRRQVIRMELENQVPEDIGKRKFLVRLFNIPPMLLGLATLDTITLKPHPEVAGAVAKTGYTTLSKVVVDTTKYQKNIRMLSALHYTSQVQSALDQINSDLRDLESLESQARGDLLYDIRELLFSYHALTAKVVRDQRKFSQSHYHANQAVRVSKDMDDSDLVAAALYVRGCTYLEWGMFGKLKQGVFQVQQDRVSRAIRDFENAKRAPKDGEKGLHPQLLGFIRTHLSRAYAILKLSKGEKFSTLAATMLDDAADGVDSQNIDDPHTRMLVTGTRIGFIKQRYYSDRAVAFNAAGLYSVALQELNTLDALQAGTVGKDLTRYHAWLDIVRANTFMGLENFEEATKRAKIALLASQDIHSITNLTNIVDIHGRLLLSIYKNEPDVEELGELLRDMQTDLIEQDY